MGRKQSVTDLQLAKMIKKYGSLGCNKKDIAAMSGLNYTYFLERMKNSDKLTQLYSVSKTGVKSELMGIMLKESRKGSFKHLDKLFNTIVVEEERAATIESLGHTDTPTDTSIIDTIMSELESK